MRNETAKRLQFKTILKAVEKTCQESKIALDKDEKESVAQTLKDINDILAKESYPGRRLFAVCEKSPKGNLDTGRHYYSIQYVKDNEIHKAWFWSFIKVFHGFIQDRDRSIDRYIFGSSAIGMSRVLDATDGVFTYLKRIGGYYHQLDCR